MVFGGLIGSYILCRIAAGGWAAERAHVNTRIAIINTLVLVTSSFTVVKAHAAAEANERGRARQFMLYTVLLGCTFLCIKAYEYSVEIEHGFVPATSLFWSFYYTMTGLHGLHVLAGIIVNFSLFVAAGGASWDKIKHRIEYAGLYWHFVDVVWIFLFPLVYLA
jgi:heme/copper-type cytochrome/quinol oxidase subunit 3